MFHNIVLSAKKPKKLYRKNNNFRGTFKSKAPLRVQFLPAYGGKGLKPKLLLGFTK